MEITCGIELLLDLQNCDRSNFSKAKLHSYFAKLCNLIAMKAEGKPAFWNNRANPNLKDISAVQFIETSSIGVHALDLPGTVLINIFSSTTFDMELAKNFSREFFAAKKIIAKQIKRKTKAYDNQKAVLQNHKKYGQGVFAKEKISKGEVIAVYDGKIYIAKKDSDLPNDPPIKIRDHVMQFTKQKSRDSKGIARFLNHSCNPNCGIKDKFVIVAMRDIKKGEELTWDYDTTEDGDWFMRCDCGSADCRKIIRGYRYLPKKTKHKYREHTAAWLIEKYGHP